ncbi:hypothetical protein Ciccas_008488 [Cichlidogyrus casuarinus]|uniref:Uncharacterized protein n=1 Tax=Cichlidogyrus casuarinus TaxID=1844966 RepID=A0ABD2PZT6_9PLAT
MADMYNDFNHKTTTVYQPGKLNKRYQQLNKSAENTKLLAPEPYRNNLEKTSTSDLPPYLGLRNSLPRLPDRVGRSSYSYNPPAALTASIPSLVQVDQYDELEQLPYSRITARVFPAKPHLYQKNKASFIKQDDIAYADVGSSDESTSGDYKTSTEANNTGVVEIRSISDLTRMFPTPNDHSDVQVEQRRRNPPQNQVVSLPAILERSESLVTSTTTSIIANDQQEDRKTIDLQSRNSTLSPAETPTKRCHSPNEMSSQPKTVSNYSTPVNAKSKSGKMMGSVRNLIANFESINEHESGSNRCLEKSSSSSNSLPTTVEIVNSKPPPKQDPWIKNSSIKSGQESSSLLLSGELTSLVSGDAPTETGSNYSIFRNAYQLQKQAPTLQRNQVSDTFTSSDEEAQTAVTPPAKGHLPRFGRRPRALNRSTNCVHRSVPRDTKVSQVVI